MTKTQTAIAILRINAIMSRVAAVQEELEELRETFRKDVMDGEERIAQVRASGEAGTIS